MSRLMTTAALLLLAGCFSPGPRRGSAVVRPLDGPAKAPHAVIATDRGDIVLRLFSDPATGPASAFSDLAFVRRVYDGTGFYRVLPGYIAQGGDRADGPVPGPPPFSIPARRSAFTRAGLVGFSDPASSGSFFVTLGPAPWLDARHVAFGEVVEGIELLRSLANGPISVMDGSGNRIDRPDVPLRILEVRAEER